jgi:hypothetical protein
MKDAVPSERKTVFHESSKINVIMSTARNAHFGMNSLDSAPTVITIVSTLTTAMKTTTPVAPTMQ